MVGDDGPGPPFIGFIGLAHPSFMPGSVEVGWRLDRAAWGRGYAPEGAAEAVRFGFEELGVGEVVSFTVPQNRNSRRVMEKIGMTHRRERDFHHPDVDPTSHPGLVRHVLYALERGERSPGWSDGPIGSSARADESQR